MPRPNRPSSRWMIIVGGGLALLAACWLLRRRMPADPIDEAAAFAGRIIQRGEDVGPRP
jgi:hypothetical protein